MRRTGSITPLAAALAVTVLTSCSTIDCDGGRHTDSLLRSVPIDSRAATSLPAPAEGEVLKQTWTIEDEGRFFVNQKIEKKESSLGVTVTALEPNEAKRLGAEPFGGLQVEWVDGSGASAHAGLIRDDIILTFSGKSVSSREQLEFLVGQTGPGAPCDLEVLRRGAKVQVKVEMGNLSRVVISRTFERKLPVLNDNARSGLRLVELSDEVKPLVLGPSAEKGLLVTSILPGGPAFLASLRMRDAVVKVGATPTPTITEFSAAIDAIPPGTVVPFTLLRDGQQVVSNVEVEKHAGSSWGFNFLGLVKYRKEPTNRHFSLIWGMLFNSSSCYSVREEGNRSVNYHESGWGAVLNLLWYKSSPRKGELRLLWIFPISWRAD